MKHYLAGIGKYYGSRILYENPVAYWKLDETTGTTAVEYIGNYDGTYQNTPTLGQPALVDYGYSAFFDSTTNEGVAVGTCTAIDFGLDDFSLEFWYHYVPDTPTFPAVVATGHASWSAGAINIVGDENIQIHTNDIYGGLVLQTTGGSGNQTKHVVITRSGANLKIYINGIEEASRADLSTSLQFNFNSANSTTYFGKNAWDAGAADFDGYIDEVAFYGSELDVDTIVAHYNFGLGIYPIDVPYSPVFEEKLLVQSNNNAGSTDFTDDADTATLTNLGDAQHGNT